MTDQSGKQTANIFLVSAATATPATGTNAVQNDDSAAKADSVQTSDSNSSAAIILPSISSAGLKTILGMTGLLYSS
jgi:hypothetical protein